MWCFPVLVLMVSATTVLGGGPAALGPQSSKEQGVDDTNGRRLSGPSGPPVEGPPPDVDINSTTTLTGRRLGIVTIVGGTAAAVALDDCLIGTIVVENAFAGVLSVHRTTVRGHVTVGAITGNVSISHSVIGSPSTTQIAVYVYQSTDSGSTFTMSHATVHAWQVGLWFMRPAHGSVTVSDSTFTVSTNSSRYRVHAVAFLSDILGPVSITNTKVRCTTTDLSNAQATAVSIGRARSSVHVHNVSIHLAGSPKTSALAGVEVQTIQPTACMFVSNVTIAVLSLSPVAQWPGRAASVFGIAVGTVLGALSVADSTISANATRSGAVMKIADVSRSAVVLRHVTLTATRSPNATAQVSTDALVIEANTGGVVVVDHSDIAAPHGACVSLPTVPSTLIGTVDLRGVRLSSCGAAVAHQNGTSYAHLDQNCVWLGASDAATTAPLGYAAATTVAPCVGNTPRTTAVDVGSAVDLGLAQCAANSWSTAPVRPPKVTTITGNYTAENEDLGFVRITSPGVVRLVNITASGIALSGMASAPPTSSSAVSVATATACSTSGPAAPAAHHVTVDGGSIGTGGITFDDRSPTQLLRLTVANTRLAALPTSPRPNVELLQPLIDSTLLFENVSIAAGTAECITTQGVTRSAILFKNVSFTTRYWSGDRGAVVSAVAFRSDVDASVLRFSVCRFDLALPPSAASLHAKLVAIAVGSSVIRPAMQESQLHVTDSSVMMAFTGTSKFLWSASILVKSCVAFDRSRLSIRCDDGRPSDAGLCERGAESVGFSFSGLPTNPSYITLSSSSVAITAGSAKVLLIDRLVSLDVVLNNLTVTVRSLPSVPSYFVAVSDRMSMTVLAVTDCSVSVDNGFGIGIPRQADQYVSVLLMNARWALRYAVLEPASTAYLNVRSGCSSSGPGEVIPCDTASRWAQSQCSMDTAVYRALGIDKDRYYPRKTPAPPGPDSPSFGQVMVIAGPIAFVVLLSVLGLSALYLRKRRSGASAGYRGIGDEMLDPRMAVDDDDRARNVAETSESAPLVLNRGAAA